MPLPTTSAIEIARRLSRKRIASKQSPPTPEAGCHDAGEFPAVNLRDLLRQQALLDLERLGEIAALGRVVQAPRAAGGDLRTQRREQMRVVPRLLDEVAHAPPHRLDREIDAAPAGHDDDR